MFGNSDDERPAHLRPRPLLGNRLLGRREPVVPVIPGQGGGTPVEASRLGPCGSCGCADTERSSRFVPGGPDGVIMLSVLCDDASACVRTYRAGMTAARYGAFLRSGTML